MDPLSSVASAPLDLRLAQALRSELSTVLRAGRVLAVEVLEASADGTALLAVAGRRVAAESKVDLAPGDRFLAVVEDASGALGLRRILAAAPDDELLLEALRAVVAEDLPAGPRVAQLLARLAAPEGRPGAPDPPDPPGAQNPTAAAGKPTAPAPTTELAGGGSVTAPATSDTAAIARLQAALREHIVPLQAGAEGDALDGPALRALLESSGLFLESRLLRAAGRGPSNLPGSWTPRTSEAPLSHDLKSVLLAALKSLAAGPKRAAVEQALAGLEAEQLLNVARARSGDAPIVGLPVPDAGAPGVPGALANLASAHVLFVREERARGEGEGSSADAADSDGEKEDRSRVALGVEFSRLGPVRADVSFQGTRLAVRFSVERADVAERIRSDLESLSEALAIDGRAASIDVAVTSRGEATLGAEAQGVRFLRDHNLVDLLG